jgi:hypothetical protein
MIGAFPILFQTRVYEYTLALAILLGVACGLIFSAAPAIHLARLDPQDGLRSSSNTPPRSRARKVLMGVEVGLAIVVLIAAALFLQSFRPARQTDPRFRSDGVLLAAYDLSGRNPDEAAEREFAARLLERLRSLPDVEAAAIATNVPVDLHGIPARPFTVQGRVRTEEGQDRAIFNTVTPGYFKAMAIPLIEGNDFAEIGDRAAPAQAIVNEEFARRYLNGSDAIGRRIQTRAGGFAIIGVARNSVYNAFGEPAQPAVYFSYRDLPAIQGELEHPSDQGDGVHGRIVSSRNGPAGEWVAFHSKTNASIARLDVKRGDTVDFVTDCRGSVEYDSFNWPAVVKYVSEPREARTGEPKEWNAKTDFSFRIVSKTDYPGKA